MARIRRVLTRDLASNFNKSIKIGCRLFVKRTNNYYSRLLEYKGTTGVGENDAFSGNVVVKSCLIADILKNGASVFEQPIRRECLKILDPELKFERIPMTPNLESECVPNCTVYQLLELKERRNKSIIDGTKYVTLFHLSVRYTVRQDRLGYQ